MLTHRKAMSRSTIPHTSQGEKEPATIRTPPVPLIRCRAHLEHRAMLVGRSIHIAIDGGRDQVFYPGAVVTGSVVYMISSNDRLHSVALNLRGYEKVLAGKNSPIKKAETIEVFHIQEILLSTPVWTEGKILKWPFSLTIPLSTGPDRSDTDKFYKSGAGDDLFDTSIHPLAPTIKQESSQGMRVEYEMYAVALFAMRASALGDPAETSMTTTVTSINYAPDLPVENESGSFVDTTFMLGSGKARRPSLMGTIRRGSRTSLSLQGGGRRLIARVPKHIVVGEDIKLSFALHADASSDMPICVLKQVSIQARLTMHRRTVDCPYDPSFTEVKKYKVGSKIENLNLSGGSASATFPTPELKDLPPTFKSYSIARTCDLIVTATVAVGAGKEKYEEEAEFTAEVDLLRRVDGTERRRRTEHDLPPTFEPATVPIEEDELPTYDMHRRNTLLGQGGLIENRAAA